MKLFWNKLKYKFSKKNLYTIRYRNNGKYDKNKMLIHENEELWTFPEAMKFMRTIPIKDSCEILDKEGNVHFTLPGR